jgi:hypothetical protein
MAGATFGVIWTPRFCGGAASREVVDKKVNTHTISITRKYLIDRTPFFINQGKVYLKHRQISIIF